MALTTTVHAQTDDSSNNVLRQAYLRAMTDAALALQIRPLREEPAAALAFRDRPIQRYSDGARGMPDATVWRLGNDGRPGALVALEIRVKPNQHVLNYEFLSLSSEPLELVSGPFQWTPTAGLLQWTPVEGAPKPAASAPLRLAQMRMLSHRFSASELYQGQRNKLRMLTQPLDRYTPSDRPNADGAIFGFVYGTNPEVVLLLESDGAGWSYAAGRLSGAAVWLMLDDREVWQQDVPVEDITHAYTSNRRSIPPTALEPTP